MKKNRFISRDLFPLKTFLALYVAEFGERTKDGYVFQYSQEFFTILFMMVYSFKLPQARSVQKQLGFKIGSYGVTSHHVMNQLSLMGIQSRFNHEEGYIEYFMDNEIYTRHTMGMVEDKVRRWMLAVHDYKKIPLEDLIKSIYTNPWYHKYKKDGS